ncbi:hypothetical protein ENSA7_06930 [Enhygromyxa salina]|uniref:Uncharacterized protein n=2 Tax=Enhygromyxa salina TaxID=215803 RepID=A0A2S9YX40_9BACT|nr:hypothetical protein ENSA7_06930 [Enhygromyxa salina]
MSSASASSNLAFLGVVVVGALLGCAEDPTEPGRNSIVEASASEEATTGHLGRVHLVLQPRPDEIEPEPQLQLHARFVEYHGVSEDFVRARTNLPLPVWDQLVVGQCIASEALLPVAHTPRANGERELTLVDAGDLRILLGNRELVAPLALVPDILPWLSGVEYAHVDDRIPRLAVEPDGTSPIVVSVDGSPDGHLESFSASVAIPMPLALETAKVADDRLTIDWRPPGRNPQTIVLRLQAFTPGEDGVREPTGEEVTCLVSDTGRADLALGPLAAAGLGAEAALLRVSASRFDTVQISAGNFGNVDVFVELRAQKTLPLL